MRPRPATLPQALVVAFSASLLCACSTTLAPDPVATASIAPRPPEGMHRYAPPPRSIETGSLGPTRTEHAYREPNYRWNESRRPPAPVRPAPDNHVIVVREGDTLYSLSRLYGVALSDIIHTNRISGGRIEVGQRLVIPPRRPALADRRY